MYGCMNVYISTYCSQRGKSFSIVFQMEKDTGVFCAVRVAFTESDCIIFPTKCIYW